MYTDPTHWSQIHERCSSNANRSEASACRRGLPGQRYAELLASDAGALCRTVALYRG